MRIAAVLTIGVLSMATLTARAPAQVPSEGSRHWSLKDGFYWTWTRPAAGGCVSWLATEDWVSVRAALEIPCDRFEQDFAVQGRGLYYFSVADNIVFKGYWPWSSEVYDKQIVFDEKGMIADILPCPQTMTTAQIKELLSFVTEAQTKAISPSERKVLSRIRERLSQVDGDSLSSSQQGCTDEARGEAGGDRSRANVWKAA